MSNAAGNYVSAGSTIKYCGQAIELSTDGGFKGEQTLVWKQTQKFQTQTAAGHLHKFTSTPTRFVRYLSAGTGKNLMMLEIVRLLCSLCQLAWVEPMTCRSYSRLYSGAGAYVVCGMRRMSTG